MTQTSHEIEGQIRTLVRAFMAAVDVEWQQRVRSIAKQGVVQYKSTPAAEERYLDFCYAELLNAAVQEIKTNNDHHPNSYSVTGMCEQVRRDKAIHLLREIEARGLSGGMLSREVRGAWKAAHSGDDDNDTIIEESF